MAKPQAEKLRSWEWPYFLPHGENWSYQRKKKNANKFFKRRREKTWNHFPDGGGHAGPKILLWLYPAGHLGHR